MELTGRIMDVKRFAVHDGPGIRTTLFLKGCPLKCRWCHNPEGISPWPQMAYYAHKCIGCGECVSVCAYGAQRMGEEGHVYDRARCVACGKCEEACLGEAMKRFGREITVEEAAQLLSEDRAFYGDQGGATLSGGEPLLQKDFAVAVLKRMREMGISTAVDTCGCVPRAAFEAALPYTDIFLYDVKHIDPEQHRRLTGQSNERILENIRFLSDAGARIEVRMPLVPGCNDDEETLRGIGAFLGKLRIERMKVLPYHAMARSKYQALGMEDTMPRVDSPSNETLNRAVSILREYQVNAVSGRE